MKCLVVVAHPDDETIWMGGLIIRHANWEWNVLSLCRSDDPDRAPRFRQAMCQLGCCAYISDLDDSPNLAPLSPDLYEIKDRIINLVPKRFDLIFTHGPHGEYTQHERHEQVHQAVHEMVETGDLTGELMSFAYEDCGGKCYPKPAQDAQIRIILRADEYAEKRRIVEGIYNFHSGSRELESAGPVEAFRANNQASKLKIILTKE